MLSPLSLNTPQIQLNKNITFKARPIGAKFLLAKNPDYHSGRHVSNILDRVSLWRNGRLTLEQTVIAQTLREARLTATDSQQSTIDVLHAPTATPHGQDVAGERLAIDKALASLPGAVRVGSDSSGVKTPKKEHKYH